MVENSRLRIVPPYGHVLSDDEALYYRKGLKFKAIGDLQLVTVIEEPPPGIPEGVSSAGGPPLLWPAVPASLSDLAVSLSC